MKSVICVIMLYLVSVCSAELRTWTAINGNKVEAEFVSSEKGVVKLKLKSGKVFEVPANKLSKEDNEFITSLVKPEGVNMDEELVFRKDIAYLKNSDTPYTGKAFALHENGQKQLEVNFKDGKYDGLFTDWHENGQKMSEGNFKDGKEYGLHTMWYENGQKQSEANYKDAKVDGLEVWWHKNGQKQIERHFKDDIKVENSEKFWNSKGEPVDSIIRSSF